MSIKHRIAISLDLAWTYRYHLDVFAGTQRYAQRASDWDCYVDEFVVEMLRDVSTGNRPYDGIIARVDRELCERAAELKIPLVNVWNNSPVVREVPGVFLNHKTSAKLAAENLLQRGFRRFACIALKRDRAHRIRTDAYRKTIEQAGFTCDVLEVGGKYDRSPKGWREFQERLSQWVGKWKPPMGLFVNFSDVMGRHVVHACQRAGHRIPEDVAVVVTGNETQLCMHPEPSLTSIDVRYEELGYQSAELLQTMLDGAPAPTEPIIIEPLGIVGRQSTDFLAVDDPIVAEALRFIAANSHRSINVDDVAEVVHVARRTLERRFRAELGRSVAEEIRRLRVERARRQLSETDLPIKQIAIDAGFSDATRMYEVFIRELGKSPSQIRAGGGGDTSRA